MDTIASISTAPGQGGIGIIRISGPLAFDIALKIFKSKKIKEKKDIISNTINYGHLYDEDKLIDEVMCSFFKAPHTYTREDVVELNVHGGIVVSKKILEVVLKNGARAAEPGEFTKRAFLNGRIDLSQVEGIASLLSAKSEAEAEISNNLLAGKLLDIINSSKKEFLNILMHLEVNIDYPEYDNPTLTKKTIYEKLNKEYINFLNFKKNFDIGNKIKNGFSLALIGKPNAGKSSLLNLLLDSDRAIVTDIAGTTRDTIEEHITIDGIPVRIIDTAGIRTSEDTVEKIGIEKSIKAANNADIIIALFDLSKDLDEEDKNIINLCKENLSNKENNKDTIFVLNKSDLENKFNEKDFEEYIKLNANLDKLNIFKISTITKDGINDLLSNLRSYLNENFYTKDSEYIIIHERQKNIIKDTIELIEKTIKDIDSAPEDILSLNIQSIVNKLNELTGENVREEILNEIFSNFCLGK